MATIALAVVGCGGVGALGQYLIALIVKERVVKAGESLLMTVVAAESDQIIRELTATSLPEGATLVTSTGLDNRSVDAKIETLSSTPKGAYTVEIEAVVQNTDDATQGSAVSTLELVVE